MAYIQGVTPGLTPNARPAPQKPAAGIKLDLNWRCTVCTGVMTDKDKRRAAQLIANGDAEEDEKYCRHCASFFGIGQAGFYGVTNVSVEVARKRIANATEFGWGMILRAGTFGAPDNTTFTVEPGDIFKVARSGMEVPVDASPATDMTAMMFSVDLTVGPYTLKLYPHEFSPLSMAEILSMVAGKELEVKYLSQDDDTGYYTPTPEIREIIKANF